MMCSPVKFFRAERAIGMSESSWRNWSGKQRRRVLFLFSGFWSTEGPPGRVMEVFGEVVSLRFLLLVNSPPSRGAIS